MAKLIFQKLLPHNLKTDSDRADELRVIGAGLPRTGTSSLKAALEILGFGPCHHMAELFDKPDRSIQFARALDRQQVDFRRLMEGYGSTVDCPTTDLYKEIHRAYPHAKIILTVRDSGDKWFGSYQNAFGSIVNNNFYYFLIYLIRFLRLQYVVVQKIEKKWMKEFGEIGPSMHDQHNARVINENDEKDLLVFNVKEGWPPLCKFLAVDIPSRIPFPKVNDAQQIKKMVRSTKIMGLCAWTFVAMAVVLIIYFLLC